MLIARIPGTTDLEFNEGYACDRAPKILKMAIEGFKGRAGKPVDIPTVMSKAIVGFSVEAILIRLGEGQSPATFPFREYRYPETSRGWCSSPAATT